MCAWLSSAVSTIHHERKEPPATVGAGPKRRHLTLESPLLTISMNKGKKSMFIVSHRDLGDCLLCSVIVAIADSFVGHSFTQQMSGGCRGLGIPLGAGDGKTLSLGSPRAPGASRIIEPWLLGRGRQEKFWAREPGSLQSLGWRGREWEPQQAGLPKAHPELQFFTISYVLVSRRFSCPPELRPHGMEG